jgi:integrase/recombinase XerD
MDHTPAPISLAAARALQPPEGSRAAEVFRDDHVWIRFAARPTSGPQVPHDRDELILHCRIGHRALSLGRRRNHDRTRRHDVRGGAYATRLRPILGGLLGLGRVLRAAPMIDDSSTLPVPIGTDTGRVSTLDQLASIPEEEIWLSKQKSARTRRAYRLDVQHFMRTLGVTTPGELRQADHKAVIAWERFMREFEHAASSTIRRRLAALSSLYKHLVRHDHAARNPVREVERPAINRDEGATAAFSKAQARKLLDLPGEDTIAGLRDRAILSVGLQVGLRRAEIAALTVGDLHQNRGYDSLRVMRKGGRRDALAINPQTAARLRAYLEKAGHGADVDGPLFRPLKHNGKRREERRGMDPDAIDRVVRKYAAALGLDRGYSAHSMRATFITTALENGAQLEDVQKAAGHRDPSTTKLYDRRGYNPEKAARMARRVVLMCESVMYAIYVI